MPQPAFDAVAAHDYWTLMGALIERKHQLGLTNLDVDYRGGLPSGYANKLFTGRRTLGIDSVGKMLAALAVRLVVVECASAAVPENAVEIRRLDERGKDIRRSEWGKKGHLKWMCLTTPAWRRKIARKAGKASAIARAKAKVEKAEEMRKAQAAALARLARDRRPRIAREA